MSKPCIDCGLPSEEGSPWCADCNAPIFVSPRKMLRDVQDQIRREMTQGGVDGDS